MGASKIIYPPSIHATTSVYHGINSWLQHNFDRSVLQGIAIGAIAFAIPVLWETAKQVQIALDKNTEKHPLQILEKASYLRFERTFKYIIMLPSMLLAFGGLAVFPALPSPWNVITEFMVAGWFISLWLVVSRKRKQSKSTVPEFLKNGDMDGKDYKDILSSLWEKTDYDIQEQFTLDISEVFIAWFDRLVEAIPDGNPDLLREMLKEFDDNIGNRSQLFMIKVRSLVSRLLELHYKVWEKHQEYDKSKNKNTELSVGYDALLSEIDRGLKTTLNRYIEFKDSYEYFEALERHTEKHLDKPEYLNYLLGYILGQEIFEQTTKSEDRHQIWSNFPKPWLITNDRLKEDKPENGIAKIWDAVYINWSRMRVFQAAEEFDIPLETVTSYLLPTYDPPFFSKFYTYILNPFTTLKERAEEMINHSPQFGFGSHSIGGSFGVGEDAFKKLEEQLAKEIEQQQSNAFDYFYKYHGDVKNKIKSDIIDADIKELKSQSSTLTDEQPKRRAEMWVRFLEDLKKRVSDKR